MVDLVYYLTNTLFFYILLLYYYISFRSSIVFCLFDGDIYLSLGMSLCFFVIASELFCGQLLETFVILSEMSLPIKSIVASADFWMTLFEDVLSASVADFLASSRSFWLYLPVTFLFYFYQYFHLCF